MNWSLAYEENFKCKDMEIHNVDDIKNAGFEIIENAIVDAESRRYQKSRVINTVNEIRIADYYYDYFDILFKDFLNITNYRLELYFYCAATSQELIQLNHEAIGPDQQMVIDDHLLP